MTTSVTQSVTKDPIKELVNIIHDRSLEKRRQMLYDWLHRHIVTLESSQLIFNPKKLTTEQHDLICEKLVHDLLDEVLNKNIPKFKVDSNRYSTIFRVIK